MLRELATVLLDIHAGLDGFARSATARGVPVALTRVDIKLPLEMRPVLAGGGCLLLADVPRSRADDAWVVPASSLALTWELYPTHLLTGDAP